MAGRSRLKSRRTWPTEVCAPTRCGWNPRSRSSSRRPRVLRTVSTAQCCGDLAEVGNHDRALPLGIDWPAPCALCVSVVQFGMVPVIGWDSPQRRRALRGKSASSSRADHELARIEGVDSRLKEKAAVPYLPRRGLPSTTWPSRDRSPSCTGRSSRAQLRVRHRSTRSCLFPYGSTPCPF